MLETKLIKLASGNHGFDTFRHQQVGGTARNNYHSEVADQFPLYITGWWFQPL